jgi:hypothetical protein
MVASGLRRHLLVSNRREQAALCAKIKAEAIKLVLSLLPDQVRATVDCDYQIGLVSVTWRGHGSFHLPANTSFGTDAKHPATLGGREF